MDEIPKYLIGSSAPDSEEIYVVRIQNPFMIARGESTGVTGIRLKCWPIQHELSAAELTKIVGAMAKIYGEEAEKLSGLPSRWSYVFDESFQPPEHLACNGIGGHDFKAVLRLKEPSLWIVPDPMNARSVLDVQLIDGTGPAEGMPALDESWAWWLNYCDAEDNLKNDSSR